ncbi:MAG: DUF4355 domain-containing protein [Propioniciclava sp.]|uniref:capsid assembly scaffolding protein Gp46 family protein n=1 Tax=Propioniciclava sp. TaxID=2038686 RepID=UPI0039E456C0
MSEGTNQQPASPAASTPATGQQQEAATGAQTGDSRTFSQEDVNRLLAAERRSQEQKFADAVTKAAQFDELENKNKTELQRSTERAEKLEKELAAERTSRLRLEVAQAKGLPAAMAARLQGSTKEELEADAEALARLLPAQQAPNTFRDAQGRPAGAPTSGDWLRDSLARR